MYTTLMNGLASGFISFESFRWIIGLSAYKLCLCQTEASQADRFHLSPRTTEVASNRRSSEPFTKVSIAFKRPPFLRSSVFSFFQSISLNDSISTTRPYNCKKKERNETSLLSINIPYYIDKNVVEKIIMYNH